MRVVMQFLSRRMILAVFVAAVAIPVALLGYDGPWLGPGDISIRGRAPFPKKLTPGTFRDFDEWFADRVGLRYPLIYAGVGLHVGLMRRPLDRHIFFGRDGWMFWTDDGEKIPATMADSRGKLRFSPLEVSRIDANIRMVRERFAACGIPVRVLIAPNKEAIYGQYLFRELTTPATTRFDALLGELSEAARSIVVDPRPAMRAAAKAHAPHLLYPKTETHWNDLGAYHAYRAVLSSFGETIAAEHMERASLDRFEIKSNRYAGGDMAVRVLFSPWRFADEFALMQPKDGAPGHQITLVHHEHTLYRNPHGSGALVLFGDSFGHALLPFFGQSFAQVHRYTRAMVDGAIAAEHRASAVVLQIVERHAHRLLIPPVNLAQLCGA